MPHDVFISFSSQDREVADIICGSLQRNGVGCWIAHDSIGEGDVWQKEIVRGIDASKVVICLLSLMSNESEQVHREIHLAFNKKKIVIPIRIEEVELSEGLELFLGDLHRLDAISPPFEGHLGAIIARIKTAIDKATPPVELPSQGQTNDSPGNHRVTGPADQRSGGARTGVEREPVASQQASAVVVRKAVKPQKVALLYKRSAQPDNHVLALLEAGLRDAGHSVFVDRHMSIGVEWVGEIERQVREADAVIPLLSSSSVQSEMLSWEVKTASDAAQQQFGKPRILPVRVGSEEPLPEPFHRIVGRLQYALWRDPEDDECLLTNLLDGLDAKEPPKPRPGPDPEPLDSRYYIVQPTDDEFHDGLMRQDGLLLVKGARQMGKTSLLGRGLQVARDAGKTVVSLDLQALNQQDLKDLPSLYKALGGLIADQMELDVYPEDTWVATKAPNVNFEKYIVREVMGKREGHVIIAMDEVDRLFAYDYASEIFGLFRSWFNARTINPSMPWGRLTQAIVYATEPHLFITDQHQSPFNVGTKIVMKDFDKKQVGHLNELYGQPLQSSDDLDRFFALLEGQPYLTRRGLDLLTRHHLTLDQLVSQANMDEGPFGDHLRRILIMVGGDKKALEVITGLVHGQPITDQMAFYNLRSGGLISGHSLEDAHFRCAIYESYLKGHLG